MRIELFLCVVFCVFCIFQLINIIVTFKQYKNERKRSIVVKAKVLNCEMEELKESEDVEAKEVYSNINLKEIHYGIIEYEYEGKKYTNRKMIPIEKISEYIPGADIEGIITKEQPSVLILERFDYKLKKDCIRNVFLFIISLIFVVLLGCLSLSDISLYERISATNEVEF